MSEPGDTDREREPRGGVKLLDGSTRQHRERDDHHEVEQDRADGNGGHPAFGVERCSDHCHQSHQHHVGCDHEEKERGQRAAFPIKSRRDHGDDGRSEENHEQGDESGDAEHREQNPPGEAIGIRLRHRHRRAA